MTRASGRLQSRLASYLHGVLFSSRRRHTRFKCDWSSDVCSCDLQVKYRGDGQISGVASFSYTFIFCCVKSASHPRDFRASRLRVRVFTTASPEWLTVDSFSRPPATVPPRPKDLSYLCDGWRPLAAYVSLTYTLMSNHFHLLCEVPQAQELSEAQLLDRIQAGYGPARRQALEQELAQLRQEPDGAHQIQRILQHYRNRLFGPSNCVQALKDRFGSW